MKDGIRFYFHCFLSWHPPSPRASSHCVETWIDAVMETIKWSSSCCSRFQRHSFSRPSASAAAQEAFPDFTTTEQQLDGVYALLDPTGEETCHPGAPEVMLRGTGTTDNGAVHSTQAASPSSILSIMFIAHYSVLKRSFFYPREFNCKTGFSDIFLAQQKQHQVQLTSAGPRVHSLVMSVLKLGYKAYKLLYHRLTNMLVLVTQTKKTTTIVSLCVAFLALLGIPCTLLVIWSWTHTET